MTTVERPVTACAHCGAEMAADAQFCGSCGRPRTKDRRLSLGLLIPALVLIIFGLGAGLGAWSSESTYASNHPESTLAPQIEQLAFGVWTLAIGVGLLLIAVWKLGRRRP